MTDARLAAIRGVILAVLAALVAGGVIDPGLSDAVTGIVAAVLTAAAAFLVSKPSDVA